MPTPPSSTGFKVEISDLLSTGYYPERFARDVPLWADVDGVSFTQKGIKRSPGFTEVGGNGSEQIRGVTTINEYATKVAYYGDLSTLYSFRIDTGGFDTVGTSYTLLDEGGATEWDSGSTVWDSGGTVWDEGAIEPSLWDFSNFGSFLIAANGVDKTQIKKNNVNFAELYTGGATGASITSGGTGYTVGDTVTHTGGTGSSFATTVLEVSSGVVTSVEVTNFGTGYTDGDTLTQSTTSGGGTGLTLSVQVTDCPYLTSHALAQLGPHILMFNLSDTSGDLPYAFAWCSEDDVDTWVGSTTNSAGVLTIREAKSPLRAAVPLGRSIAVYTTDQLFVVSYIGAPFYFGYTTALTHGVGAVSKHSVVSVGNTNYGLSKEGFFMTDGSSVSDIGQESGINDYLLNNIAKTEYAKVTAWHNKEENEIVWLVPLGDVGINTEIVYNYTTGTWTKRTSTKTSGVSSGVFDSPIIGDNAGKIHYANGGNGAINVFATSRAHDLDDADRIKEVSSIRVGKIGGGSPQVRVGWADSANGTPVWTDSFIVDGTFHENHTRTSGRYLFIDVSSSGGSDNWEITDFVIQGRVSGTR